MQTLEQIEQDIIRRVFDESFLNEKLLTKLLHAYGAARAAAEREKIKEAVYTQANALLVQIEASAISDDFRSGYKRGVNTALDAMRD